MTIFEKIFHGMTILIQCIHMALFIGLIHYKPKWIPLYQYYMKLVIGIILVVLFFPFRVFREKGTQMLYTYFGLTRPLVNALVFSSGIILLSSFFMGSVAQIQ